MICMTELRQDKKKLLSSPDEKHILTIAMDGENCWENYPNDGHEFLETLYKLILEDDDLETVRVSDYLDEIDKLENRKNSFVLETIKPGSWINRDFLLWIGEPTKNLAWTYMDNARCALIDYQQKYPEDENLEAAWQELLISQSSDWYWWYGEPNDSGQDDIFDHLFREHLKNIYKAIKKPVPKYLETPLAEFIETHSRYPQGVFEHFELDGKNTNSKWENAGCIDIPAPPTMQERRFFNKIYFGYDTENLYLRFDINKFILDKDNGFKDFNQIYIYFKNSPNAMYYSAPIRVVNKNESIIPIIRETYNSEVKLTLFKNFKFNALLAHAIRDNLWVLQIKNNIEQVFEDFLEVKIPFEDLRVSKGEMIEFFIIQGPVGIIDDFYPQNSLLQVIRPVSSAAGVL